MLEKIEVGNYIDGWGYHLSDKIIEALGTEFTYQHAEEYSIPAREEKAAKAAEKAAAIQVIFDTAKATGEKQVLRSYTASCNDPHEECSTDAVTVYAMPDGSTKTERQHTW